MQKVADRPIVSVSPPPSLSQMGKGFFVCLPVSPFLSLCMTGWASILVPASPQTHSHPSFPPILSRFLRPWCTFCRTSVFCLSVGDWLEKDSSPLCCFPTLLLPHSDCLCYHVIQRAAIELRVLAFPSLERKKGFFCGGIFAWPSLTENNIRAAHKNKRKKVQTKKEQPLRSRRKGRKGPMRDQSDKS